MKTPICTFDAKTAILCTKCETKLRLGQLTDTDIEGAIKDFIIALSGADIGTIRSNPTLLKKFEDEFQSKVWFVEAQATDKRFIENLFFPIRILAVNIVWLPDGTKLTKAIISALDKIEPQQHGKNKTNCKENQEH